MTTVDIRWRSRPVADSLVLEPEGTLDASTYRTFRDGLIKFAMDQPRSVIVVVDDLRVASVGALTAFSSAWMRVGDWPGVPILLVAGAPELHDALVHSAMARFVPVYTGVEAALATLGDPPSRRRAETELVGVAASSRVARAFVRSTCARWGLAASVEDATEVATELVENAVVHAGTDLGLRLELRNGKLTVAVRDGSPRQAVLRERADYPARGLHVVTYLSRVWGCAPDLHGGKVVWAVLDV